MANYDLSQDVRFNQDLSEQFVDTLDKHGFPVVAGIDKNVHKIGFGVGEELNVYIGKAGQLFIQSKLSTAEGEDLDLFGVQFKLPRTVNETDEHYRKRLKAIFSPKKVTYPYILEAIEDLVNTNPPVTLFEPWRYVLKNDNVDPYPYGYLDIGPSRMWSPDYWRSGVLVIQSGLTKDLIGIVEALVSLGVFVWYDQVDYSIVEGDGLILNHYSYLEIQQQTATKYAGNFYCDLLVPGACDIDINSFLDIDAFMLAPGHFDLKIQAKATLDMPHESEYEITSYLWTDLALYMEENPGDYLLIAELFTLSSTIDFSTNISLVADYVDSMTNGINFTSAVGQEYVHTFSDTFAIITEIPEDFIVGQFVFSTITFSTNVVNIVEFIESRSDSFNVTDASLSVYDWINQWTFDDGVGTVAYDARGLINFDVTNGTWNVDGSLTMVGQTNGATVERFKSQSAVFNGGSFTILVDVKFNDMTGTTPPNGEFFGLIKTDADSGFLISQKGTALKVSTIVAGTVGADWNTLTLTNDTTKRRYVILRYNRVGGAGNNESTLFHALEGSSTSNNASTTAPLITGESVGVYTHNFQSKVAAIGNNCSYYDLQYYNKALSDADIATLISDWQGGLP